MNKKLDKLIKCPDGVIYPYIDDTFSVKRGKRFDFSEKYGEIHVVKRNPVHLKIYTGFSYPLNTMIIYETHSLDEVLAMLKKEGYTNKKNDMI